MPQPKPTKSEKLSEEQLWSEPEPEPLSPTQKAESFREAREHIRLNREQVSMPVPRTPDEIRQSRLA